ncbi:MAG: DUF4157 domain-containing protein, partial [Rubrivivax sp.]|nr:DUF4157 domain-containing protein [Rubrivivax sp.]
MRSPLETAVKPQSSWTEAMAGSVGSSVGSMAGGSHRRMLIMRDPLSGAGTDVDKTDARAYLSGLLQQTGGGKPLDSGVRGSMQSLLGHDLSAARIHTGPTAARAASALQAQAFTIGSHVFFGGNRYDPHSPRGQSLLAHELTHVIQQTTGRTGGLRPFSRQGGDTLEQEAQLAAQHVLARVGRPSGLMVDDYARTYETEDDSEISAADQKRLDTISLLALQMAEKSLTLKGYKTDT